MDIRLDTETFLRLVEELGVGLALGVALFFAIVRSVPYITRAMTEDRQSKRDHEYRLTELALKFRERAQLDLEVKPSEPAQADKDEES